MSTFFLTVVNMSISASWIVLAVLLLRLVLKKAPKWIPLLLWGIVALRLVCPFRFESVLSLIPSAQTISPQIMTDATPRIDAGIDAINNAVNPVISGSFTPDPGTSMNPLQLWIPVFAIVWAVGVTAMLVYAAISYRRVKQQVGTAVLLRDNIFQSEHVVSPFVLGLIRPRIYLPFRMNEQDTAHVVAHEQAHICRKDHWWKPLGFLLLAIHWFNPLLWLGYVLLCRDIELACDEKVVREMDVQQKADYSQALLSCSINRRTIAACPLAFGEVGVKDRVKSVLSYKKPAFWIIVAAVILTCIAAVCFLTDPATGMDAQMSAFMEETVLAHHRGKYKTGEFCCADIQVLGKEKSGNTVTVYAWVLYQEFDRDNGKLEHVSGAHIPTVITLTRENGVYSLAEYWEPRDGTYYPEDIKAKFPWHLRLQALNSQWYIDRQKENCLHAAEAYFKAVGDSLTWTYTPGLSYTGHSYFPFAFTELDYTHLEATCTEGLLQDLANVELPKAQTLTFPKGVMVYWTPDEGVTENIPNISRVTFTLYSGEEIRGRATVAFTCVERTLGSARFAVSVEEATAYPILEEGMIRFVEEDSISDMGGADDSELETTIYPLPKKAPRLAVISNDQSTVAAKGTSSWTYQQADGTGMHIQTDGSHPLTLIDTMPVVDLLPSYISSLEPLSANIQFQDVTGNIITLLKPDTVTVRCWAEDQWYNQNPKSETVPVTVRNGNLYMELMDGNYIYEVTATWNREAYSGNAIYCFRTNKSQQIHYPQIDADSQVVLQCDKTPFEQIQSAYDNEEFVITVAHCQLDSGLWAADRYSYQYRLEITGRLHDAAMNTTYIVLSNTRELTFDKVWKAAGLSSNSEDYFDPADAVIVGHRLFA